MTEQQPHFLRLPYNVRRKIYCDLGMIVNYALTLPAFNRGEWSSREQKLVRDNDQWACIPNQLFYVCRAISEDARAMLFSENYLWFSDENCWGGMKTLLNLSPLGWKSLRTIVVTISTKGCQYWFRPETERPYTTCHADATEIFENDRRLAASGALATWRLICSQLGTYNKEDNRLELYLVCGAASQETAAEFLAPIRQLPCLKGLSIRMGPHRNHDLQQMIMTTIRQKTHYFPCDPEGTFPFERLPVEIQIRVLEYSGLVTPKALISRFPDEPFIPTDCRNFVCGALPDGFRHCKDCYCPATHTAFSTVYSCWTASIPYALFLVSKRVREIALFVYYARNVIEIWYKPSGGLPAPAGPLWEPHISGFLSRVPEHSWKNLRHIHWVFPQMKPNVFRPNTRETVDWIKTLSALFKAVHPSAITLELSFDRPSWADLRSVDPIRIDAEWALYGRIVEPIARWRSLLNDIFIHSYCHFYLKEDPRPSNERALEQKVMGAGYDSLLRGKTYPDTF
ncbi:hypothetical protein BJY01DRAFT_230462 [Aspergillus pseudoustus]|uniref:Heterokaryon incompatibility domain-containing protein n=1 Tax=Aspergillus pseudoustus TaxID=1810923 RepID=A0ABR4I9N5_9EURO